MFNDNLHPLIEKSISLHTMLLRVIDFVVVVEVVGVVFSLSLFFLRVILKMASFI